MKSIYLDNASTTSLRAEVIQEMTRVLTEVYGNPSSTHRLGRDARALLESSRKSIAQHLGCSSSEIIFTSGATEANNMAIRSAIIDFKVERIITSKIEHHAVLHTVEKYASVFSKDLVFVNLLDDGQIDLNHLEELLREDVPTFVSLMHVNNEIGNITDLTTVGNLCRKFGAIFHSDTVQSIGKIPMNLNELPVDFIVASAHKFHGPKGIGFLYIRKGLMVNPMLFGGEQEKGRRPGTESLHNISGMAKALELSSSNSEIEIPQIAGIKQHAIESILKEIPGSKVNGSEENAIATVLNINLNWDSSKTGMLLFNLDLKGIFASRGSACQSGSLRPSHVLAEILSGEDLYKPSLRLSFSHENTKEDIDDLVMALKEIAQN